MTRFANSTAQTAAEGSHVLYAILVSLDFASGFVRAFNGAGTIVYGGNTYLGVGQYGSIGVIGESMDVRPVNPVVLTLSGLPDSATPILAAAASNRADYFGRSAQVDTAFYDATRNVITPIELGVWEGVMDSIVVDRGQNAIQLTCEDRMILFDKTCAMFFTDETQQTLYSGDKGCDQGAMLANRRLVWGGGPTPGSGAGHGGPGGFHLTPNL